MARHATTRPRRTLHDRWRRLLALVGWVNQSDIEDALLRHPARKGARP